MNKAILVVDMLHDFVSPTGSLYVPGAEKLVSRIADLLTKAREKGVKIIYANDAHAENDEEFKSWPKHCVKGTPGAANVPTLAPQPGDLVCEKQQLSALTSPAFKDWLGTLNSEQPYTFYVVGVATDYCVKAAAIGLSEYAPLRLSPVEEIMVVADCIAGVDLNAGDVALAVCDMVMAGAGFLKAEDVLKD